MMKGFKVLSAAEQVANRLRKEIAQGQWVGLMPGEDRLMKHLGIGHNTIREALNQLVSEGLLENQGAGRQRKITTVSKPRARTLRIGILLHDRGDASQPFTNFLRQELLKAGHIPSFADKTLQALNMDPAAVERHVTDKAFDAWMVIAGTKAVFEWFAKYDTPTFAIYGDFNGVDIAGGSVRKSALIMDLFQELVDMGHRKIVTFARKDKVIPIRGGFEELFIAKLESSGIPTSDYNLPIWNEDPNSLEETLEKLFKHTPPTAIFTDEPHHFCAIQNHLARRSILAPRDVSLICGQPSNEFILQKPLPTHFTWDYTRMIGKAVTWANTIARGGSPPKKHWLTNSKLIRGGTVGPPPKRG